MNNTAEHNTSRYIVLLGPPGSGKGTQAERLEKRFSLFHFSTGEMFREAVREGSELGQLVEGIMRRGDLVPDEVLYSLVKEKLYSLGDSAKGVLFDGYPRTVVQAQQLDEILAERNQTLDAVIFIDVSEETLIKRLSGRLYCPACEITYNVYFKPPQKDNVCDKCGGELSRRSEDTPEAIRARIEVYNVQTTPLLEHYSEQDKLIRVNGEQSVEDVFEEISRILGNG